ncbi:MAG TPA: hypothetical protein VGN26_12420 [Armatimonadota bacterium]
MIAVVTMASAQKSYSLGLCLESIAHLEAPEGQEVHHHYLVVTDGSIELNPYQHGLTGVAMVETEPLNPQESGALRAARLRQRAVEWLREQRGLESVLWVDNDVILELDSLRVMLDATQPLGLLSEGPVVLSAILPYRRSGGPILRPEPFVGEGATPVEGFGFGCVLMPASALSVGWEAYLERPEFGTGEDLWWCRRAKEAGYALWALPSVRPWHLDDSGIAGQSVPQADGTWSRQIRRFEVARKRDEGAPEPTGAKVLIALTDGVNHRLGELRRGRPVKEWVDGTPFSEADLLELAESGHLELVNVAHVPADEPEAEAAEAAPIEAPEVAPAEV